MDGIHHAPPGAMTNGSSPLNRGDATHLVAGDMSIDGGHHSRPGTTTTSDGADHRPPPSITDGIANGVSHGPGDGAALASTLAALDDDDATRPGLGAAPRKVDVSHFPHYGLKRGMACTFCRRRKLRCSGDRPLCTNCVKHSKVCEYGPPVKEPKKQASGGAGGAGGTRVLYDIGLGTSVPTVQQGILHGPHAVTSSLSDHHSGNLYGTPQVQQQLPYAHLGGTNVSTPMTSNVMSLDPSLVAVNTMPPSNHIMHPAACDFGTLSPFVTTPQQPHTPQHAQQHPMAQPIIGMPPYVSPSSGYPFPDPNAAVQQQQWLPSGALAPPMVTPSLGSGTMTPTTILPAQSPYPQGTPMSVTMSETQALPMQHMPSASIAQRTSDPSTPDEGMPRASTQRSNTNSDTASSSTTPASRPQASKMYQKTACLQYPAEIKTIDGLTERLGEFLFSPTASAVKDEEAVKRRRPQGRLTATTPASVARLAREYDGLLDTSRSLLLDCFLAHTTLFFEMSVPRFRYRMTFSDRRRPSLALLNAMYLWATRISNSPQMSTMEQHFFEAACKHLDTSTSTVDRLMDGLRAAMLLSAYSHSSGRHHEGWVVAGVAIRLVLSCGLHRIRSCVHKAEEPVNPFLRNRFFLLPPAEDAVELGERIHAFWAVFAMDRCGSLATGYPAGIRDADITTPFGRSLADIASGAVSERDDITVRDIYRGIGSENDIPYTKWVKCVAILERSAKLCFLEPAEDSPYQLAWNQYTLTLHRDPLQTKPPEYLNQPKYRTPRDYRECLLAVEQLMANIGDEGVFPVVRRMHAEQDGGPEPVIPTNIVMLHHMVAAVHMVLHDINSIDVENPKALKAARKSVLLFRAMPQIPFTDVDAFVVLVWSMITKVLIKETHRLSLAGLQESANAVALEADTIIGEMARIGETMYLARTQAKAVEELKRAALAAGDKDAPLAGSLPQLESFMFPQLM